MTDFSHIRQSLYEHADVSGHEQFAHDLIVDTLKRCLPSVLYDHVGGYGVVAVWYATQGDAGRSVAFRADIDALPIGHRCGHDGHTAALLRFAEMLSHNENRRCNVVLVFQPSEEDGTGAKRVVDSGLMQKHGVQVIYGMHNLPGYELGHVVMNRHTFAAASTGVIYHLQGRSTHASTPEKGLDPALPMAEIIKDLLSLNSTENDLSRFRQISFIGCRAGAEAFGTTAGDADVLFTLRAYTNDAMNGLVEQCREIVGRVASGAGLGQEVEYRDPFKATENDTELVDEMIRYFKDAGKVVVEETVPFRWSEDFSEYLTVFRGVFFGVGSGIMQPELHNPEYVFPDAAIDEIADCFSLILNNVRI